MRITKRAVLFVLPVLFVALSPSTAMGQEALIRVSGRVTDALGAPIAHGIVRLKSVEPGEVIAKSSTAATGNFQFSVAAGRYGLLVEIPGFGRRTVSMVALSADVEVAPISLEIVVDICGPAFEVPVIRFPLSSKLPLQWQPAGSDKRP